MNSITIGMPLISNLSVNHYLGRRKGGGYYVKPEVKQWQETLGWLIRECELKQDTRITDWNLPLTVKCDIVQNDKRVRDAHNYFKVVCDAIEEATGINDTSYLTEAGIPKYDKDAKAELVITIKEGYEKRNLRNKG